MFTWVTLQSTFLPLTIIMKSRPNDWTVAYMYEPSLFQGGKQGVYTSMTGLGKNWKSNLKGY